MQNIPQIIVTAHCDKAARANNEDSCLVCADLSQSDSIYSGDGNPPYLSGMMDLGERGCLLVVADGMGGMNAGEVASRTAVESVSNFFSTQLENISGKTDEELLRKIEEAIQYADMSIKFDAEQNPEHSGMGTTIAILWLLRGNAYVGWCGDSRIYRFNTFTGKLERLTHDHSLVQMLVDEGDITEADAFNHPKSNIIMRSLGDSAEKVKPETRKKAIPLHNGDVFLLCSDGLHGAIPDKPLTGKQPKKLSIESILVHASEVFAPSQLDKWNDLLWEAAEERWHDNVTSILCHVSHCGSDAETDVLTGTEKETDMEEQTTLTQTKMSEKSKPILKWLAIFAVLAVLATTLLFVVRGKIREKEIPNRQTELLDTSAVQSASPGEDSLSQENAGSPSDNMGKGKQGKTTGGDFSTGKNDSHDESESNSNETNKDSI